MRILVLGGSAFVGRHIVDAAIAAGHRVTTFNRGKSNPIVPPGVEALRGDRNGDVSALRDRTWDAVIDTSAYHPRAVESVLEVLSGAVEFYAFVSSISVYRELPPHGPDEHTPVHTAADGNDPEVSLARYGGLKVACEQIVEEAMPERNLIVRAGLIVGPHDYDDRFSYWLLRMARGGEALAPGGPERRVQCIDARDLAAWIVRCVTGPARPLTFGEMLETMQKVTGGSASLTWVSDELLTAEGIQPFNEVPYWMPASSPGVFFSRIDKALAAGLAFRPLEVTIGDTWAWLQEGRQADQRVRDARQVRLESGISEARERELLAAWREMAE